VPVGGQRFLNVRGLHDLETSAISNTPVFVFNLREMTQCVLELLSGLGQIWILGFA
jgi:hypothetical protein